MLLTKLPYHSQHFKVGRMLRSRLLSYGAFVRTFVMARSACRLPLDLHRRIPFRSRADQCHQGRQERIALLIDGDAFGPSAWAPAVAEARKKGHVVCARVFCPADFSRSKTWMKAAADLGIQFETVHRRAGGAKDPNDMAIAMEASRLLSLREASCVAFVVCDMDFTYVAERLHALGHTALAVLPEGSSNRLVQAFRQVCADVVRFQQHQDGPHAPKKKLVLHLNGEGSMEDASTKEVWESGPDESAIAERLLELQYLSSLDDPLVPGLAKLYRAEQIGPLVVWPTSIALHQAASVLASSSKSWKANPGNLVFALPMSGGGKGSIGKYGTINCARFARAGGPFMMFDSEFLVAAVLQKLGYVDRDFNPDVTEAIDVFCRMKLNKRALASIGLRIAPTFAPHTKIALLHGALVSPRTTGTWQLAPSDAHLRTVFAHRGLISHEHAPQSEVCLALKAYVQKHALRCWKSYNGLVTEVLHYFERHNACMRT